MPYHAPLTKCNTNSKASDCWGYFCSRHRERGQYQQHRLIDICCCTTQTHSRQSTLLRNKIQTHITRSTSRVNAEKYETYLAGDFNINLLNHEVHSETASFLNTHIICVLQLSKLCISVIQLSH